MSEEYPFSDLDFDNPFPTAMYSTVELEKLRIGLQEIISSELLGTELDLEEYLAGHLLLKLRGYIWSETLDEWKAEYPADWWQAFKERWFSGWVLKRWPVVYIRKHVKLKVLYPEYKVAMPDDTHRLTLMKW